MSTGLDNLKNIVVLMMENRSFDHMLGSRVPDKFSASASSTGTGMEFKFDREKGARKYHARGT